MASARSQQSRRAFMAGTAVALGAAAFKGCYYSVCFKRSGFYSVQIIGSYI